jgi:hypothetical protein
VIALLGLLPAIPAWAVPATVMAIIDEGSRCVPTRPDYESSRRA